MPATLDKSRPYATLHGQPLYHYEQDGKCFTHDGRECDRDGRPINGPTTDSFGLKPLPTPDDLDDDDDLIGGGDDEDAGDGDDLEAMANKELRKLYTEMTGDKLRVALKTDQIREIIRALRRGETPEAA